MNIDKTNFIKYIATLSAKDKSTCLKDIWADAFPGIEIFAVGVMQEIIKRKTPYVFSIEGGYGTGKTFFSTRFSEYLKKEEINNIYFSAWESDYMPDPFLSFSKAITQFIEKDNLVCEDDINLSKLKKAVFKGLGNVISSINMEVAIPTVTKIRISGKALVNNWSKTSKESDDPILNMQKSLKDIITKLKNSKLVLIVDELDRCRPDYAVKTLETVKHFFDIEGIIVIFPVHRDKLNEYINGFYNLNSNKNNEETYLQKFISNEGDFKIPPPKYEYLCNDVLLEEVFRDCSNIKLEGESYNSLFQLKKWLAEYGKKSKLTSREFKEVIGNAIIICKSNKIGKVRCNYLSSLLCKKKYKE
ncbi:MAG: hypothetical protein JJV96_02115, partial [Alphaproteobacteria bacterium]|nr:hypothetical protein [Alphaproteobacteria bacterium]